MFFFPVVYRRGFRYRARGRFIHWRGVHRVCDQFPDGTAWRVWCGWLLITVLIDRWPPPGDRGVYGHKGAYPPMPWPTPPPPRPPPGPPRRR